MRMDGVADVGDLAAHLDGERGFGDQVAGMHADDARADDAVRRFIEDQLGEAFGTADADRAAGGGPRELADADLEALGLRFGLGDADPGDFRVGVGHRRNHACDPFLLLAGGDFRRELAFVRGFVRQHRLADDVADGEDVRHVGAHLPVDLDEAALGDGDAGLVGIELPAIRRAADGDQDAVVGVLRGNAGTFETADDALLVRPGVDDLGLEVHGDALLLQAVGERLDEVGVRARHQLVHEFDHGDFGAERAIDRRHFQADDAATDDEQRLRDVLEFERVGRIHHAAVVPGEGRQLHRLRAGGDDALLETHE